MNKNKLSKFIKQIRGVSYKPTDLLEETDVGAVPILRANNIYNGCLNFDELVFVQSKRVGKDQYLRKGDILICASSGSKELVGKAAYVSEDLNMAFGAFCKVIRPNELNYSKYLGHFFQSDKYKHIISSSAQGANINNLRSEHIDELEVEIPELNIIENSVNTLDRVSNLLSLRHQQLEKLDLLVKSRFVEMFGDNSINTKYKTQTIGETIDSIEAGWSGNGEQRPRKSGEIAVLKVSAVTKGYFLPEECKVLNDQKNIKKYVYPEKGDIIFSRANTREMVGATALILDDYPELILPDKLWKIRFADYTNPYYMKAILSSKSIRNEFSNASTGTSGSMYNVSMDKFKSVRIPIPPLSLQTQFAAFVQQVDKSKFAIKKSLDKLELLKKKLMQDYFG